MFVDFFSSSHGFSMEFGPCKPFILWSVDYFVDFEVCFGSLLEDPATARLKLPETGLLFEDIKAFYGNYLCLFRWLIVVLETF